MTTSSMQTSVLDVLGVDSTDTYLLARALKWLQKSYDKLIAFVPEAEYLQKSENYLTTVADQATYALPSDFFQLLSLRDDTNSTIIDVITREQFDRNHPDPSGESTSKPYECTTEYDRVNKRHVIRLAAIPDDAYVLYAVMRCWPPALSSSVDPLHYKLETTLEEGGVYHGSLETHADAEYTNYRAELKTNWLEAVEGISQIFNVQKPSPPQVPEKLRKSDY